MTPPIVTLCGSTRFKDAFLDAQRDLTLQGVVVLTVGWFSHAEGNGHKEDALGREQAAALDRLHKQKIAMSDSIYVLNVGGYIGDSTRSEIAYANELGLPIHYLEPVR